MTEIGQCVFRFTERKEEVGRSVDGSAGYIQTRANIGLVVAPWLCHRRIIPAYSLTCYNETHFLCRAPFWSYGNVLQWPPYNHNTTSTGPPCPRSISKAQSTQNSLTVPPHSVTSILFPYYCTTIFNTFQYSYVSKRGASVLLPRRFPAICCEYI